MRPSPRPQAATQGQIKELPTKSETVGMPQPHVTIISQCRRACCAAGGGAAASLSDEQALWSVLFYPECALPPAFLAAAKAAVPRVCAGKLRMDSPRRCRPALQQRRASAPPPTLCQASTRVHTLQHSFSPESVPAVCVRVSLSLLAGSIAIPNNCRCAKLRGASAKRWRRPESNRRPSACCYVLSIGHTCM